MTRFRDAPVWRAAEVGPGGVPLDEIRPVEPRLEGRMASPPTGPASLTDRLRPVSADAHPDRGPSAVFGDFDFAPADTGFDSDRPGQDRFGSGPAAGARGPSRRAVLGWLALAVGVAVLVAALLWSDPAQAPGQTSGALAPGSCLASSSDRSVVVLHCADPGVEFTVAATYPGTTDTDRCAEVSSDLMLVTRDDVVLCLNYRAAVGECLYAGRAVDVGKAPCRVPGSATTPVGLFRVLAVLPRTVDVRRCPTGTITTLVHVTVPEVLCLGLP